MYITPSQFRVEGDGAAFDEWLLPLTDKMRALPGNVLYRMLHDPRNPPSVLRWARATCTSTTGAAPRDISSAAVSAPSTGSLTATRCIVKSTSSGPPAGFRPVDRRPGDQADFSRTPPVNRTVSRRAVSFRSPLR